MISFKKYIFDNVARNIIKGLKVTEHEYFFSKYSRNLNISEIFWSYIYTHNFVNSYLNNFMLHIKIQLK